MRFVALIALLLAGCASNPEPTPVAAAIPSGTTVTITRSNSPYSLLAPVAIRMNGAKVADLGIGQTFTAPVSAGPVRLGASVWSAPGSFDLAFTAVEGQSYRFLVSPRAESVMAGMLGGTVGMAAEGNGPFKITAMP